MELQRVTKGMDCSSHYVGDKFYSGRKRAPFCWKVRVVRCMFCKCLRIWWWAACGSPCCKFSNIICKLLIHNRYDNQGRRGGFAYKAPYHSSNPQAWMLYEFLCPPKYNLSLSLPTNWLTSYNIVRHYIVFNYELVYIFSVRWYLMSLW